VLPMDRGTYTIRRSSARFWFCFALSPRGRSSARASYGPQHMDHSTHTIRKVQLVHLTDRSTYTIRRGSARFFHFSFLRLAPKGEVPLVLLTDRCTYTIR
jgi:hypothetical protein